MAENDYTETLGDLMVSVTYEAATMVRVDVGGGVLCPDIGGIIGTEVDRYTDGQDCLAVVVTSMACRIPTIARINVKYQGADSVDAWELCSDPDPFAVCIAEASYPTHPCLEISCPPHGVINDPFKVAALPNDPDNPLQIVSSSATELEALVYLGLQQNPNAGATGDYGFRPTVVTEEYDNSNQAVRDTFFFRVIANLATPGARAYYTGKISACKSNAVEAEAGSNLHLTDNTYRCPRYKWQVTYHNAGPSAGPAPSDEGQVALYRVTACTDADGAPDPKIGDETEIDFDYDCCPHDGSIPAGWAPGVDYTDPVCFCGECSPPDPCTAELNGELESPPEPNAWEPALTDPPIVRVFPLVGALSAQEPYENFAPNLVAVFQVPLGNCLNTLATTPQNQWPDFSTIDLEGPTTNYQQCAIIRMPTTADTGAGPTPVVAWAQTSAVLCLGAEDEDQDKQYQKIRATEVSLVGTPSGCFCRCCECNPCTAPDARATYTAAGVFSDFRCVNTYEYFFPDPGTGSITTDWRLEEHTLDDLTELERHCGQVLGFLPAVSTGGQAFSYPFGSHLRRYINAQPIQYEGLGPVTPFGQCVGNDGLGGHGQPVTDVGTPSGVNGYNSGIVTSVQRRTVDCGPSGGYATGASEAHKGCVDFNLSQAALDDNAAAAADGPFTHELPSSCEDETPYECTAGDYTQQYARPTCNAPDSFMGSAVDFYDAWWWEDQWQSDKRFCVCTRDTDEPPGSKNLHTDAIGGDYYDCTGVSFTAIEYEVPYTYAKHLKPAPGSPPYPVVDAEGFCKVTLCVPSAWVRGAPPSTAHQLTGFRSWVDDGPFGGSGSGNVTLEPSAVGPPAFDLITTCWHCIADLVQFWAGAKAYVNAFDCDPATPNWDQL